MKLFAKKDQELLVDILRFSIKILLLIVMFMVFTVIPGVILMFIISIIDGHDLSFYKDTILSLWIVSILISFIVILIKLNQE